MDIVAKQAIELLHLGFVGQHVEVLTDDTHVITNSRPRLRQSGGKARAPCVPSRR